MRIYSLEEARTILLTLKQRLAFTLATPKELLSEVADSGRFKDCVFINAASSLCDETDFETGWSRAVNQSEQAFEPEDIELICQFGSIIGKSDLETQQRQLEMLLQQLDEQIKGAKLKSEDKKRLYISLGTLGGLMAAVILI